MGLSERSKCVDAAMQESEENRALTNYSTDPSPSAKKPSLLDRPLIKGALYTWVLFATCLTVSDGLLTPVRLQSQTHFLSIC